MGGNAKVDLRSIVVRRYPAFPTPGKKCLAFNEPPGPGLARGGTHLLTIGRQVTFPHTGAGERLRDVAADK
jgi:hypothetical protein